MTRSQSVWLTSSPCTKNRTGTLALLVDSDGPLRELEFTLHTGLHHPSHAGSSVEQEIRKRPVVLGTLSVRVDPSAERMAIDSAIESGMPLIIANILRLRPYPATLALVGPEGLNLPHEEDLDGVRATAARAAELGVQTELLRVTTRHPVNAPSRSSVERNAGLLVFGPDLRRVNRLRFRLVARRLRREAGCLICGGPGWVVECALAGT